MVLMMGLAKGSERDTKTELLMVLRWAVKMELMTETVKD
jgi:hypothetical protein